jgi:hypothetical protein
MGAGIKQVRVLDGGLLQELEDAGEQEHLIPIDVPIGYGRV